VIADAGFIPEANERGEACPKRHALDGKARGHNPDRVTLVQKMGTVPLHLHPVSAQPSPWPS